MMTFEQAIEQLKKDYIEFTRTAEKGKPVITFKPEQGFVLANESAVVVTDLPTQSQLLMPELVKMIADGKHRYLSLYFDIEIDENKDSKYETARSIVKAATGNAELKEYLLGILEKVAGKYIESRRADLQELCDICTGKAEINDWSLFANIYTYERYKELEDNEANGGYY
jgi:hypothetical protein